MTTIDHFSLSLLDFAIHSIEEALQSGLADEEFLREADCAIKVLRRHLRKSNESRFAAIALLLYGFDVLGVVDHSRDERRSALKSALERLNFAKEQLFSAA